MAAAPVARRGNLASLGAVQLARVVAGMGVNLIVMRSLGVEGFGVYGYVTTLVGLASFGAGLGMDRLLKRELARDPGSAGHRVATALLASFVLWVATGIGIAAWVALVDGRPYVLLAALLATLALGLQVLMAVPVAYFHAIRHMSLGVRGSLAGKAVLLLGTALAGALGLGVPGVFAAQVLEACVTFAAVWGAFRGLGVVLTPTGRAEAAALIRASLPFGLNTFFGSLYLSVDVLLLAWLCGDAEVGVYRAAVMLLALFPVLADTFTSGLYPRMSRHLGRPELAGAELRFTSRILLAVSVPAAVGAMLTAEPILVLLGGAPFAASALPFAVMAPLLPLRFLNNGFGMTLSALDRQGLRTLGVFLAAVLNVFANLLVLPRFGAIGAAATTLLTEGMLLAWNHRAIAPIVTELRLGDALVRVALPTVAMAAVMLLLPPLPVLVAILSGAAVYVAAALLTGGLRRDDLHQLRSV